MKVGGEKRIRRFLKANTPDAHGCVSTIDVAYWAEQCKDDIRDLLKEYRKLRGRMEQWGVI